MKVVFIHHSCFLVEVDEKVLIFDWFAGDRVNGYRFEGVLPEYEPDTPVYVFASHKHADHFDMDVLRWADKYSNSHIRNFLFNCRVNAMLFQKIRRHLAKYEIDGGVHVETLRSTDAGVAFYVMTNGATFFHAGDLNDWSFEGADDLTTWKMRREFQTEIKRLASKDINIAFVPMDPRLGKNQWNAVDFILEQTDAECVFPMHMWQDYSGIEEYVRRQKNPKLAAKVVPITHENEEFDFNEV